MYTNWDRKLKAGAIRRGCMACGAHTLAAPDCCATRCVCCGSVDLGSVDDADIVQVEVRRRRLPAGVRPFIDLSHPLVNAAALHTTLDVRA